MLTSLRSIVAVIGFMTIPLYVSAQEVVSHSIWNELTSKHVSKDGTVDYKGFIADSIKLHQYLDSLSKSPPQNEWKRNAKLAYWINAYNAFTIKLIIDNYPVSSIKDLGGSMYKVNTPWDIEFILIGDQIYDLNDIEHNIIRKKFKDPRIHFAVNCASYSCPRLRNEAYTGKKLNEQLDDQAVLFINDTRKNIITAKSARLSKIFLWYRNDFKIDDNDVVDFINKYSEVKISTKTKTSFLEYNWKLNE